MIGLVPIIQTERGRRLFYEGPMPGEEGDPWIGLLWGIGLQILALALLGWLIWLLFYLASLWG